jgi:Domain of unknown function (DUF1844)
MSDEKKIIVDEDWKSQVEAEKQAAQEVQPPEQPVADAANQPGPAADMQFPPASFDLLLTTLATETLVALGQLPHPVTGKAKAHRNHAKYLIDTIDVLREKTKGNLTPEEQQGIEGLLHQLRMAFVSSQNAPASEGGGEQ